MRLRLILLFMLLTNAAIAQDIAFARKMVDTLTSPYFWGRGYTKDGLKKTADFLATEFRSYGLKPLIKDSYFQSFYYPVNTFPGKMKVVINGKLLSPGKDYIISPESRGIKAKAKLQAKDSITFIDRNNRIIVLLQSKLTWSVAQKEAEYTTVIVDRNALRQSPSVIKIDVENRVISQFKTANVCGIIRGTSCPDSLLVITAHYDHLGGMGKYTYFPGANDNASGLSLLLNLAKYYADNPSKYSIAFICFSGEEAGLIGSKYFTQHAPVNLKNIRFLINVDLVGTGTEGITVVNATEFSPEFTVLKKINEQEYYLNKILPRGKAANSDHYWFTQLGVPSFFIYTMGGTKAYHDIFDRAATLPLNEYDDLFKLIVSFNKTLTE